VNEYNCLLMGGGLRTQDIWIRAGGISKVSKLSLLKNNKNQKKNLGNLRPTKKVDFTDNYLLASFVPFPLSVK
jgi:hypothetical protein